MNVGWLIIVSSTIEHHICKYTLIDDFYVIELEYIINIYSLGGTPNPRLEGCGGVGTTKSLVG